MKQFQDLWRNVRISGRSDKLVSKIFWKWNCSITFRWTKDDENVWETKPFCSFFSSNTELENPLRSEIVSEHFKELKSFRIFWGTNVCETSWQLDAFKKKNSKKTPISSRSKAGTILYSDWETQHLRSNLIIILGHAHDVSSQMELRVEFRCCLIIFLCFFFPSRFAGCLM